MAHSVQIFKGGSPWGEATRVQIMVMITVGKRPDRPEGTEALGLTTELWDCLTNCWHQQPEGRITISDVLAFLNSTWVLIHIRDETMYAQSMIPEFRRTRVSWWALRDPNYRSAGQRRS